MVVEREQQSAGLVEWIRFAHEFESAGRIARKYDNILIRGRFEELMHCVARAFNQQRGQCGRGVRGVRVPEDVRKQELHVFLNLRAGVETASGVIQIQMSQPVESLVVRMPQLIDGCRSPVVRVLVEKRAFGFALRGSEEHTSELQ